MKICLQEKSNSRKGKFMVELNDNELKSINGGGISFWTGAGIVGIFVFLAGVIDGFTRPLACN